MIGAKYKKTCPNCTKDFDTNVQKKKCCSSICRKELKSKFKVRAILIKNCIVCTCEFSTTNSRKLTCSVKCSKKHNRDMIDKNRSEKKNYYKEYNKEWRRTHIGNVTKQEEGE